MSRNLHKNKDVIMGYTQTTTDIIWHYTTIDNTVNILTGKQLWATHCRFLNDTSEITNTAKHLYDKLKNKYPQGIGLESLLSDLEIISEENLWAFFCLSFSGNGDSLPLWMGYVPRGGCAIGFDKELLFQKFPRERKSKEGYRLLSGSVFKCFYTDLLTESKFKELDQYFDDICLRQQEYSNGKSSARPLTNLNIANLLGAVKDQSFASEDEYRFLFIHNAKKKDIKTCPVKFYRQRPFIEIKLPDNCIREIRLSPHGTTADTENFLHYICRYLHNEDRIKISKSKLTYRIAGI